MTSAWEWERRKFVVHNWMLDTGIVIKRMYNNKCTMQKGCITITCKTPSHSYLMTYQGVSVSVQITKYNNPNSSEWYVTYFRDLETCKESQNLDYVYTIMGYKKVNFFYKMWYHIVKHYLFVQKAPFQTPYSCGWVLHKAILRSAFNYLAARHIWITSNFMKIFPKWVIKPERNAFNLLVTL